MILYHGSNVAVERPQLVKQTRYLDFVYENRMGTYKGMSYELIYGAVANDDVYETFNLFATGALDKEDALKRLKVKKLYNQLVFTSQQALSFLKFKSVLDKED